jgi:hypothetical protein
LVRSGQLENGYVI